jgi:hypothetical protein
MKEMRNLIRCQWYCVCDGQQEEAYLAHLSKLLKTQTRQVRFSFVLNKTDIPKSIQKIRHTEAGKAVLFDHDGRSDMQFTRELQVCKKENFFPAYSNRNFDLWLLLHKEDFMKPVASNDAYLPFIRKAYGLGNEENIKSAEIIEKMLRQIALPDVKKAIARAEEIRSRKLSVDAVRKGGIDCFGNPDIFAHEFIKKVLEECHEPLD